MANTIDAIARQSVAKTSGLIKDITTYFRGNLRTRVKVIIIGL